MRPWEQEQPSAFDAFGQADEVGFDVLERLKLQAVEPYDFFEPAGNVSRRAFLIGLFVVRRVRLRS